MPKTPQQDRRRNNDSPDSTNRSGCSPGAAPADGDLGTRSRTQLCRKEGVFQAPEWESRQCSIEWAAVLQPGRDGYVRKGVFLKPADEENWFLVRDLFVDAVIEFAADTIQRGPRGGKHKVSNRWYGVVRQITETFVEVDSYAEEHQAILATQTAQPMLQGSGPTGESLKARHEQLVAELRIVETQLYVDIRLRQLHMHEVWRTRELEFAERFGLSGPE